MPNITENPDYQLLMKYLKSITPNDMDQESSEQLMMIGQRIEAGGALSDREREMFEAVVGATDRFPVEQINTFPQGTNPDLMKDPNMGTVSDSEMQMYKNNLPRPTDPNMGTVSDAEMQMYKNNLPSNVMSMDDAIAAGLVNPTRPKARPMMTSPRPQMRR